MMWWNALSALGGMSVTGPLGIAVAVWLLAGRTWRLSLSWCLLFGIGMLLVVVTKVAWYGWGIGIPDWNFAGLSGHAMRSCAVYPVVFYLMFLKARPVSRHAALAAGVLLAVLISFSRLPVGAHSLSEVVLGGAVGLAVAAAFVVTARSEQPAVVGRILVALCVPLVLVMPFTKQVPAEQWVRQVAVQLSGNDPTPRKWKHGPDRKKVRQLQQVRQVQQAI
ncbi:phosphatase PAP2 family protein [Pseudoduganella umbonata]|uniref:Membrane-associated phospholipid phosphatase n=2 Tax=Pseudoduganella umbonata TaxID=864828 RepID=A0A7W5HC75_9BURK|nr:phosphatase PAP2 family protein [Pseudoduganella umbonata]MBB3221364.1 membrane-associated phospholipid phosphatase [Pseudoduganella umbonata]